MDLRCGRAACYLTLAAEVDPPAECRAIRAVSSRLGEPFHEHSAVGADHLLAGQVVHVGGEFYVGQAELTDVRQQLAQRGGCEAAPLLPRDDGIADVASTCGGSAAVPGCQRTLIKPAKSSSQIHFR